MVSITLKKQIQSFITYSACLLASKGAHLLFIPVCYATLDSSSFVHLGIYTSLIMLLSLLTTGGIYRWWWFNATHHTETEQRKITNDLLALHFLFAIFTYSTLSISLFLLDGIYIFSLDWKLLLASYIFAYTTNLAELTYQHLRYTENHQLLIMTQLCGTIACLTISGIFFLTNSVSALGYLISIQSASIPACFLGIYMYYRDAYSACYTKLSLKDIKTYIRNGSAFIFESITLWSLVASPRYILSYAHSLHEASLFIIISYVVQLCDLGLLLPIQHIYKPYLFKLYQIADPQEVEISNKRLMYFCMILGFVMLGTLYSMSTITTQYALYNNIMQPVILLAIGCIFLVGSQFLILVAHHRKQHKTISSIFSIVAFIQILFTYLLGSQYGCIGAAASMSITYAILFFTLAAIY